MKDRTIVQRLKLTLILIISLSLVGELVSWWVEREITMAEEKAAEKLDKLLLTVARVRFDVLQMSDALRGVLLNPADEGEQKRKLDADADLKTAVTEIKTLITDQPALLKALDAVGDYDEKTLNMLEDEVMKLAKTDIEAAKKDYAEKYLPARRHQDGLLGDFAKIAETEASKAEVKSTLTTWLGFGFVGAMLIVSISLGRSLTLAIQRPLAGLIEGMNRMRRGDFTERLRIERRDEFGELAEGLNRTCDELGTLVAHVQKSGIQVNTSITEIAATAKEQQATANETAATVTEIGATSKEISATSRELVKTMGEVSGVAEQTAGLATSGQTGLVRMEETMRNIMDAAGSINAKLSVLNEKAGNINQVVTTITKVADQTNLLSLNAAIEAEKAGEYGRGFAVVATEIRRLADQTAVATYDIEQMIKEMQSAVSAGVMGMDKFSLEVRRGVEEVRQVGAQLAQIIQQVQALTPRFETVNDSMQAQSTGAQQISEALVQLSEAAQQTAESLQQSNLAIQQLNEVASGLRNSISKFKLQSAA